MNKIILYTLFAGTLSLCCQTVGAKERKEMRSEQRNEPKNGQAPALTSYVDPRIGSEGLGRVFIGPATPFGMVRPSPDCTPSPNSGWLPQPAQVDGFAQVHVSGTGGGPKYGNILVMPFCGPLDAAQHIAYRDTEHVALGYYDTTFRGSGIRTEITTAPRASFYRFTYPADSLAALSIDAGFFLGWNPVPDGREAQQFVGSEIEVVSDRAVQGYTRIRGGWNNGRAYTVYFYAEADRPFTHTATWRSQKTAANPWAETTITDDKVQTDNGHMTGALVQFGQPSSEGNDIQATTHQSSEASARQVQLRIGISFISCRKAQSNAEEEIPAFDFAATHRRLLDQWETLLSRIEIAPKTPTEQKRMFYTALYHTMLMPSDRTGENPLWNDPGVPYYDDFYAIWDTYRSSSPLITLIDPEREADIVNSLINIYRRDGYMPDARSGNANGRTQGGSNGEIVIADAFVKGLKGIDYEWALKAMLKDATVDPGANHEAEGRGGLTDYLRLGYVPYGTDRAGNRTIEYAYCDYAIARVAEGLGYTDLAQHYYKQSENWKNLWRADYEDAGAKGFIMPRDARGQWLDSLSYGRGGKLKYRYTPTLFEGPWYTPWWSMFFYEASSWEYSFSIPHDVPGLIALCGGPAAFERRLDTFFERGAEPTTGDGGRKTPIGFYNVNNEPSFLTPCLYHWLGKPERSSDRIREIITRHFSDQPAGLPGNDDSGAMSSWLAFHAMGLYPNAGQDYYLIHTPLIASTTLHLAGGRDFRIVARGLSAKNRYIVKATLRGEDYPYSTIRHRDLMEGGELVLVMGSKPKGWGNAMFAEKDEVVKEKEEAATAELQGVKRKRQRDAKREKLSENNVEGAQTNTWVPLTEEMMFTHRLHGQTRRFLIQFSKQDERIRLDWRIERNTQWWRGSFTLTPEALNSGSELSGLMPEDGLHTVLPSHQTAYLLPLKTLQELKRQSKTTWNGTTWHLLRESASRPQHTTSPLLHLVSETEETEMWVKDDEHLPVIWKMQGNPAEINWEVTR